MWGLAHFLYSLFLFIILNWLSLYFGLFVGQDLHLLHILLLWQSLQAPLPVIRQHSALFLWQPCWRYTNYGWSWDCLTHIFCDYRSKRCIDWVCYVVSTVPSFVYLIKKAGGHCFSTALCLLPYRFICVNEKTIMLAKVHRIFQLFNLIKLMTVYIAL